MTGNIKVALLGGGGVRTPLLIHGLVHAPPDIGILELALYDVDARRSGLMARIGAELARDSGIAITTPSSVEKTVDGASFVLSSIRVGGIEARARDERIAMTHGLAGQETTGPGGIAMALRTIPVALAHARSIERYAPKAWLINFTNPAGLITQALTTQSNVKVVGICDTPAELFHRIAWALGEPFPEMEFQYGGLNHLGWVRKVLLRGEDITSRILTDDDTLLRLYPADLFDPVLIRTLGLIPTEYLFFYYSQRKAYRNQISADATRGEEIAGLNRDLLEQLHSQTGSGDCSIAIHTYKEYLNRRNSSYMRLEGNAESALDQGAQDWDPFEGATGYHRIAIDVMTALSSSWPAKLVVNVANRDAVQGLEPEDVVEVPCLVDRAGAIPLLYGSLPEAVRGLVLSMKSCERLTIRAAVEKSFDLARLALLMNPIVGQWEIAGEALREIVGGDAKGLGYLQ
ncbi:MAG: 6-phospho-beta-glucosidase [Acidobacteriota bacterium]|nr:6-phospho-beta-glucosidase [Acidobacteriota bacterium]